MNQTKSIKDYFKDVAAVLNKPVHLTEILSTPISIPGISKPRRTKKKAPLKNAKKAEPAPVSQRGFLLEGTLQPGVKTKFSVCDTDFEIDSNTWIVGSIEIGAHVKVKGQTVFDKRIATQLVVLRQP